jgi:hypothetical protein
MAELRGDRLDRLDQGLIGSVEARGAKRLGKKARRAGDDQRRGRGDIRDRLVCGRLGWLDHLVGWLVQVMDQ